MTAILNARRLLVIGAALAATLAGAQETNPVRTRPHDVGDARGLLIRFKNTSNASRVAAVSTEDKAAALAARLGYAVKRERRIGRSVHAVELDANEPLESQLARVRADASVAEATLDRRRYAHAFPNDPFYPQQWYLAADAATPSAVDAEHAWDITAGSSGVVVAVLDTGVRFDHPDLGHAETGGRLLPGYDFISGAAAANDGDGRDADPTDPGDFVSQSDTGTSTFRDCDVTDSSWHGTRVAGLVGARTNNAEGVAGGTWSPWILPVRVLGKCGGFDSDIIEAMLWAAGLHVDGVPDNPYPAKVENLSLGSFGACSFAYQDVIDELAAVGTLVVASAGNEGGPVDSPANCAGAVAVAGLRHAGTKVGYSSLGPEIAVSAPAGNCVNLSGACIYSIETTVNFGTTTPGSNGYTDQINFNVGTSFSAPIVAAIAGLVASVNGNLDAAQLRARLMEGATTPFPVASDRTVPTCHVPSGPNDVQITECNCTTDVCGAGMANALGAVTAALRPIAALAVPSAFSAGQNVQLDATGSAAACGANVASYEWSVTDGTGVVTPNPDPATAFIVAPTSGTTVVRLTVTDDAGRTDFADVAVGSTHATTLAPASAGTAACPVEIPAPTVPEVTVSVSPSDITLESGHTQVFAANVSNTTNKAVSWYVNGTLGGNAASGTISTAGAYAAPSGVTASTNVTVTAAWSGDPSRTGSARVTVTPPAASHGGSGGGSLAWLELIALLGALAASGRSPPRHGEHAARGRTR
jgi:serine protease